MSHRETAEWTTTGTDTVPQEAVAVDDRSAAVRIVALVPLRGGSKSIPLKNIKPIAGLPLCVWSLVAALDSAIFDDVYVSTDDERIAGVVRRHTPAVKIIERPVELATDTASTESVMLHLARHVPFDLLCTIQATSPLTTPDDFRVAVETFRASRADSLVTAVRTKRFFWNDDGTPINYDPAQRPRRQDFRGTLMENGAFYLTTRTLLEGTGSRLGGRIVVHEMHEDTAAEIDEPADWDVIERLLFRRQCAARTASTPNNTSGTFPATVSGPASSTGVPPAPVSPYPEQDLTVRLRTLEWLFVDVDGTLTDGGMYYAADGEALKRFNTRDAAGLRRLRERGVNVGIITSEDSAITRARASKLGIETVFTGVTDKAATLRTFAAERSVDLDRIGLVGDDLNDLAAMRIVGFAACPADAVPEIEVAAHFVATAPGGYGAVREVCERIIAAI